MTDNEIIKAVESAIQRYKDVTHYVSCIVDINILKNVLDLINRQKEEIKQWKEMLDSSVSSKRNVVDNIGYEKSAAIKEFAGTVRRYIKSYCNPYGKPTLDYDTSLKIMHFIDNLVKEMTEVNENENQN